MQRQRLVYDVTKASSLEKAKSWVKELQRQANSNIVIAFVGNKIDLVQSTDGDATAGDDEAEKKLPTPLKRTTRLLHLHLEIRATLPPSLHLLLPLVLPLAEQLLENAKYRRRKRKLTLKSRDCYSLKPPPRPEKVSSRSLLKSRKRSRLNSCSRILGRELAEEPLELARGPDSRLLLAGKVERGSI